MRIVSILGIAAMIVCFQNCGQTGFSGSANHPLLDSLTLPQFKAESKSFANCQEIIDWKAERQRLSDQVWQEYWSSPGSPIPVSMASNTSGTADSSSAAAASITNVQEAGVDEADMLKADDDYLYVARTASVEIISKTTFNVVQTLSVRGFSKLKLYLADGKLVVLGVKFPTYEYSPMSILPEGTYKPGSVLMKFYKRAGGDLVSDGEKTFSGNLVNSRLNNGKVILVMQKDWTVVPVPATDSVIADIPCGKIQRPVIDDFSFDLSAIHQIALADKNVESMGLIGRADSIYMSQENLYILSSGYSWFQWDLRINSDLLWQSQIVRKIHIGDGEIKPRAAGLVFGHIRDVWAFKEFGDKLYIATTYWKTQSHNRLWVLEEKGSTLAISGKSEEFGIGEDIRSVRYIDDKAYIVTFQRTDPLFTFDLSAGPNPKLISEIKIPGFSAYLHPLNNNIMLGVGFGAEDNGSWALIQGLQLSLFDLRDPSDVKTIEQKEMGGRGSFAQVTRNHHAIFQEGSFVALPVTLASDPAHPSDVEFTGALFFDLANSIRIAGSVSHSEWIPVWCKNRYQSGDVRRVTKVGRYLASVSPFGLKVTDPGNNFTTVKALSFGNAESECSNMISNYYSGLD